MRREDGSLSRVMTTTWGLLGRSLTPKTIGYGERGGWGELEIGASFCTGMFVRGEGRYWVLALWYGSLIELFGVKVWGYGLGW